MAGRRMQNEDKLFGTLVSFYMTEHFNEAENQRTQAFQTFWWPILFFWKINFS